MNIFQRLYSLLALSLLACAPAYAQTASAPSSEIHYQTIINADREPPLGVTFGDLYLSIAPDGAIRGTYRKFDGIAYGPLCSVYGTRRGTSLNMQLELDPVLTLSGFEDGDRLEGTASDGIAIYRFRALRVAS